MSGLSRRVKAPIKAFAISCAVAALVCSAPASAADMQSERLVYNIMVGGLHIGNTMIGLNQTEAGYTTEMKVTAGGLAKWVRDFRSEMKGEGRFGEGAGKPLPAVYSRQWSNGEIAGDLTMTFDAGTREAAVQERYFNPETDKDIAYDQLPWNDPGEKPRPLPPAKMRTDVLDPMAAFIAARGQLMAQGLAGGKAKIFRVPIYDGRRRYDIVGRAEAARDVEIGGVERSVIPVIAKLEPVYGFGRKSQERMQESEGKFMFSNDARFIPLQLVVSNEFLSGVMNLTADCSVNAAPCDTFGQKTE